MNEQINIIMTLRSLDSSQGGPARSVDRLARELFSKGSKLDLFTSDNNDQLIKKNKQNQRNGIRRGYSSNQDGTSLLSFVEKSLNQNRDTLLIHNHGIWLPLNHSASVIARKYSIPLVISPRGMLEPWARNYRRWKKNIAWFIYQRRDLQSAKILHATSIKEATNLLSLNLRIPIAIIPNGIDVPLIQKDVDGTREFKTVLFLGRIHQVKGLENLVKAWAKIRPKGWRAVIAGPDEDGYKAKLLRLIDKHHLSRSFKFLGLVSDDDKWKVYRRADVFVLPSHSENFGIVVGEALASGTPAITTKGTPWAELDDYSCGWWVDSGVAPLASALREATNLSDEDRKAMGKRGRRLINQKYSWDQIGAEMLSVYLWLLRGGPQPNCIVTNL